MGVMATILLPASSLAAEHIRAETHKAKRSFDCRLCALFLYESHPGRSRLAQTLPDLRELMVERSSASVNQTIQIKPVGPRKARKESWSSSLDLYIYA